MHNEGMAGTDALGQRHGVDRSELFGSTQDLPGQFVRTTQSGLGRLSFQTMRQGQRIAKIVQNRQSPCQQIGTTRISPASGHQAQPHPGMRQTQRHITAQRPRPRLLIVPAGLGNLPFHQIGMPDMAEDNRFEVGTVQSTTKRQSGIKMLPGLAAIALIHRGYPGAGMGRNPDGVVVAGLQQSDGCVDCCQGAFPRAKQLKQRDGRAQQSPTATRCEIG